MTKRRIWFVSLGVLAGLCCSPALAAEQAAEKVPVLFDTDLGTGADDAFALALILATPELDLRGVTTAGPGAEDRAWMVCRFLTHAGRKDVPVAWGRGEQPGRPVDWQIQYRRHPAVVWDRTAKPVKASAVELMYAAVKADPGKVTLIAAGPLTNVAALIEQHPDCKPWIKRIIWSSTPAPAAAPAPAPPAPAAEGEDEGEPPAFDGDVGAEPAGESDDKLAAIVAGSGVPMVTVPMFATAELKLQPGDRVELFEAATPLTFQVQALYELWDQADPVLASPVAVSLALSDDFCDLVDVPGAKGDKGKSKSRLVRKVDDKLFLRWYVQRVAGFGESVLPEPPGNRAELVVDENRMPARVHVVEDYETDIEKRWWMTGKLETLDVRPGSRRACRATVTQDYDDRMGDTKAHYRAVVFNPVPGPPMGPNTRLRFRYKLTGTDTVRVQLYSLSNGYHRYLSLDGLTEDEWAEATVDMTKIRRPDGTGGPLAADERIDDIQFYIDPRAELLIDDVVLYDAAPADEKRPFPKSIVFTGWFDTGKQGAEWPGKFEIVPHDAPLTWKAAKSVPDAEAGGSSILINLRGPRPLPPVVELRFRYRVTGADAIDVALVNNKTGRRVAGRVERVAADKWSEGGVRFAATIPASRGAEDAAAPGLVDEIRFAVPKGATLWVDDVLLYEPGGNAG